ncbi:glycoside hydrolase family 38 N-terminal domain-containing protein [Enterococcus sp. LJL98]
MKKKTLYLIHHSHTDIGYTDRQEKISRYHVNFIRTAIRFLDQIEAGEAPQWEGYNYVCENYWQVEQFLAHATLEEKASFEKYVEKGLIDISLTYLNLTELIDSEMLDKKFADAKNYVSQFNRHFDSAMTADINGFSWGYADLMYKNGIRNFYSCLHTHHGMFPLFKKQMPFWWETQAGEKVLVWNGDHYQIGNDFLFSPNTDQSKQYGVEGFTEQDWANQFEVTKEKIFGFFDILEKEKYEWDFVPAMISGIVTDNSPTSPRMMEGIHRWNKVYGDEIEVKLVTLNHFFEILRSKEDLEIPTYKGDWADWWADGVSSTPAGVKLYRDAQRKYRIANKLDPKGERGTPEKLKEAEDNLVMYAEHTWGFHSSVSEPWDAFVNLLDTRKLAYAINGNRLISDHLDDVLETYGEEQSQLDRESYYKVINPHESKGKMLTSVSVQHWQTVDDSYFYTSLNDFVDVVDCKTGEVLVSQASNSSRGKKISFVLELEPKEERIIRLKRKEASIRMNGKYYNHAHVGTEQIADIAPYEGFTHDVSIYGVKTDHLDLTIDPKVGITSLIDRSTGAQLLHPDAAYAPFSGIYEVTDYCESNPYSVRSVMGRNRKAPSTVRSGSKLVNVKQLEDGPLYAVLLLKYELAGTGMYDVVLTIRKDAPQIDVTIRLQKIGEWSPENLYVSLPYI